MQFLCLIFILWVEHILAKSDLGVLLDFKKGIQRDPSGHVFGSWDGNSVEADECPTSWYGIRCIEGQVSSITLNDLGLNGILDFSVLGELKTLRNLSISNNNFAGTLLSELGEIRSLEFLDLSANLFHGSIPIDLVNLENLVYLNLSSNNLSGPIPSNFGNLQQLKYFDLHSNDISGGIGRILRQLQSVVYIDLSCNRFSGSLNLAFNNYTFVQSVQYLNFSSNGLVGELFGTSEMPLFDNLEVFDAANNHLVGQIPPFNFVVSLRILRLGNNQFSGSLPEGLLRESSMVLTELDLSCNQLQGPIGTITSTTLKSLNLSFNELSGSLPAKVGHVGIVDLSNNMLTGNLSVIASWGNYVEVIHLSSNLLTGMFPNDTSQFLRLTSIRIFNNSLQGFLPVVIGTYSELNTIDLSHNQLNGSLPPSLFASLRLTHLNLSQNSFAGALPLPSFSQNSSLQSLDLSGNLFCGSLPPEITTMGQLNLLNLADNNISGHIPKEIGKLYNLVYLDLSTNSIDGTIPDDLPNGLKNFNVSFNNLAGVVPRNLMTFPDSSFHPGNSLLVFPQGASPKNGPGMVSRSQKGMKSGSRAALIAGSVGGATLVTLFIVLVCYLSRGREHQGRKSSARDIGGKDTYQDRGIQNISKSSALSFSQDGLVPSESRSVPTQGDILATPSEIVPVTKVGPSVKSLIAESSPPKDIGKSSPMSLFSSAPHSSDHLPVVRVSSPDKLAGDLHIFDSSFVFTAEELSSAPAEVIGRSCHGTTYKATLESGHVLTVKWLREGIAKGKKEFARESKKLANIRHPNIVSLKGYYWGPKEHERLIISDYINARSLALHLSVTEPREFPPLSLSQRLKVATDIACSLNYLHNERAIPHGNLKSTNILLEGPNLKTYLSDYSLHRIMNPAGTAEQVLNLGALGYCPPEFASTSKPSPSLKSDIYAFGVILLETLTGRCAGEIVSGNPGQVDLTEWVRLLANANRSMECFDRQIIGSGRDVEEPLKGMEEMLNVSLRCILPASERPDIRTIFQDLLAIVL